MYFQHDPESPTDPLQSVLDRFPGRWAPDAVELARVHALVVSNDEDWVDWLDDASGSVDAEPRPDLWRR